MISFGSSKVNMGLYPQWRCQVSLRNKVFGVSLSKGCCRKNDSILLENDAKKVIKGFVLVQIPSQDSNIV